MYGFRQNSFVNIATLMILVLQNPFHQNKSSSDNEGTLKGTEICVSLEKAGFEDLKAL